MSDKQYTVTLPPAADPDRPAMKYYPAHGLGMIEFDLPPLDSSWKLWSLRYRVSASGANQPAITWVLVLTQRDPLDQVCQPRDLFEVLDLELYTKRPVCISYEAAEIDDRPLSEVKLSLVPDVPAMPTALIYDASVPIDVHLN